MSNVLENPTASYPDVTVNVEDFTESSSPIRGKPGNDVIWSPVRNAYVKKSKVALLEIELVSETVTNFGQEAPFGF